MTSWCMQDADADEAAAAAAAAAWMDSIGKWIPNYHLKGSGIHFGKKKSVPTEMDKFREISVQFRTQFVEFSRFETQNSF